MRRPDRLRTLKTMIAPKTQLTINGEHLIERQLEQQQALTAVERFAQAHELSEAPTQERYYRDLLPLDRPAEDQQYAFEVNLDACSGCKSCVAACHNLNGLDKGETWRDVGQLISNLAEESFAQHVTSACHHCVEPACMHGCPVNAYEKDAATGIVKHLDDQCIGCQYCTLKCPYDVPKYHKGMGIVRKCDMCSDRLAAGEAPACVQACPTQAIRITVVDQQNIRDEAEARRFLPGAPEPDYTMPTTRFKTKRDLHDTRPADYYQVSPEHAHTPLVIMLVLTQLSVGAFLAGYLVDRLTGGGLGGVLLNVHATLALVLGLLALGASTLHLGRPLYAFRAVLGLRRSWLSREIAAFGGFAKLAIAYAACLWLTPDLLGGLAQSVLGVSVIGAGVVGVFCSAMIYHDTRRVLWRLDRTSVRFVGSMFVLGLPSVMLAALIAHSLSDTQPVVRFIDSVGRPICAVLAAVTLGKLLFEAMALRHLRDREHTPMKRTAILMAGPLQRITKVRFVTGLIGGVAIPLLVASIDPNALSSAGLFVAISLIMLLALIGELAERYLFFTAVVRPKMPGGLGA